jgi:uncharacterized repeat protein (TIGR03803 family)
MLRKSLSACSRAAAIVATLILVNASWAASKEKVLYSFTGGNDGGQPVAKLIFDKSGNLYGTTANGGAHNAGAVFKLAPSNGGWKETVLHSFTGGIDGAYPLADLIFDNAGKLYGTAAQGGADGFGVIFELAPNSGGGWTEVVLHSFTGPGSDGAVPVAGLIFDDKGNLYGTTESGGGNSFGAAFEVEHSRGGWSESELFQFYSYGLYPLAGLLIDKAGNLYGAAAVGGAGGHGTVYQATLTNGSWVQTELYGFTGGSDGNFPGYGRLVFDKAGNLYGTTEQGGVNDMGTVFELASKNGGWTETVLYNFTGDGDGAYPLSGLAFDLTGHLYGTTHQGGLGGYGTVFKLTPKSGGGWTERVFHSFTGRRDGAYPIADVVLDNKGRLYGTTPYGGRNNAGVVFVVEP